MGISAGVFAAGRRSYGSLKRRCLIAAGRRSYEDAVFAATSRSYGSRKRGGLIAAGRRSYGFGFAGV